MSHFLKDLPFFTSFNDSIDPLDTNNGFYWSYGFSDFEDELCNRTFCHWVCLAKMTEALQALGGDFEECELYLPKNKFSIDSTFSAISVRKGFTPSMIFSGALQFRLKSGRFFAWSVSKDSWVFSDEELIVSPITLHNAIKSFHKMIDEEFETKLFKDYLVNKMKYIATLQYSEFKNPRSQANLTRVMTKYVDARIERYKDTYFETWSVTQSLNAKMEETFLGDFIKDLFQKKDEHIKMLWL